MNRELYYYIIILNYIVHKFELKSLCSLCSMSQYGSAFQILLTAGQKKLSHVLAGHSTFAVIHY